MERKDFKMLVSYEEAKEVLQILFDNFIKPKNDD